MGGVEEGSRGHSRVMMRQEAERGARVHQEVPTRDGIPQNEELATGEQSG